MVTKVSRLEKALPEIEGRRRARALLAEQRFEHQDVRGLVLADLLEDRPCLCRNPGWTPAPGRRTRPRAARVVSAKLSAVELFRLIGPWAWAFLVMKPRLSGSVASGEGSRRAFRCAAARLSVTPQVEVSSDSSAPRIVVLSWHAAPRSGAAAEKSIGVTMNAADGRDHLVRLAEGVEAVAVDHVVAGEVGAAGDEVADHRRMPRLHRNDLPAASRRSSSSKRKPAPL